jgi:ATP-dependent DNA ligase
MRSMADRARPSPPQDPLLWRPMSPAVTRKPPEINDPLVEPLWSGTRVMVHLGEGEPRIRLIDGFGVDLADQVPDLAALVAGAVDAQDAVIDAVLTSEATRGGVGAAMIAEPKVSLTSMVMRHDPGVEVVRRDPNEDPVEGFVALDLLRLEGESLLDLPLLERKRLLESVVVQSDQVRVSVHARPPVDAWVGTWQGAGLRGAMLKAANSRYIPGGRTYEWRTVTRVASRR